MKYKTLLLACSLQLVACSIFAQVGVDSLYKSQTIGNTLRNQRCGNGLQIEDSIITNGIGLFNSSVGIGTNNPAFKLEVEGDSTALRVTSDNTTFEISHNLLGTGISGVGVNYMHDASKNFSLILGNIGGEPAGQIAYNNDTADIGVVVTMESASMIATDTAGNPFAIVEARDPEGVQIAGVDSGSVNNSLTVRKGNDTFLAGSPSFIVRNDGKVIYPTGACAGCILADDGAGLGIVEYVTNKTSDGVFTIDGSSNMFAGTTISNLGSQNFVASIGSATGLTGNDNILIGMLCAPNATTAGNNVFIGSLTGLNIEDGSSNIAIGYATDPGNFSSCVLLGEGAAASAANQFVVQAIYDGYFGNGISAGVPSNFALHATSGAGTDISGADFTLAAGQPTGSGTPGEIIFQTAPTGATGTTLRTLADAGKFDASTTAGDTRFFLYDVDNGTLERVTVGAADSGGSGFKVLRIPN